LDDQPNHDHTEETSKDKENKDDFVTPEQQAALRNTIAKERKGKKGRPPSATTKTKVAGKPKAKPKAKSKSKGATQKPKTTGKVKGSKETKPPKKRPSRDLGDPEKSEGDRTFGCSRCRYAKKGCTTCRNPAFKPRRRRNVDDES